MLLRFLGANRQVTGSRYLLEAAGRKILIDCGLYQERCCLERNWAMSPVPPGEIDHLLLTHAHLDHCGLIPRLVNEGYGGPIHATFPSIDLARVVLEDAGEIQEEDAKYKKKRHHREGRKGAHPEEPLYTKQDAANSFRQFNGVQYNVPFALDDHVRVEYHDAGHILGSASVEVTVSEGDVTRRVLFSGDVGQWDRPLMNTPSVPSRADYVILESTYGDRSHESYGSVDEVLAKIINDAVERGGNILIPTFAIDRAQEVMFHLGRLVRDARIPQLTTFLDSPMALDATTIYKHYKHLLDQTTQDMLEKGEHPFQFPGMHFVRTARESRSINSIRGSCIIMAGSGMCTGGRIKHHLRHNLQRPESTVLFVGYQAADTLGRQILERAPEVRIHGRQYPVRAAIEKLNAFSAHADREDLMRWLESLESPPRHVYLTHGEERASESLAEHIREKLGWAVTVPEYGEVTELG